MNVELPMQIVWALIGYILTTTGLFIWWAATTTQQLKTLEKLVNELSALNSSFVRREDVARELGVVERNLETLFTKFDKLKEKVDSNGHILNSKGE